VNGSLPLAEREVTALGLLFVVVLQGAAQFPADVEGVAALGPEPVVHERDAQLAVDRTGVRAARAPAGGRVGAVKGDGGEDVFVLDANVESLGSPLVHVELVVDFADPAGAGGHHQVGVQGVGVVEQEGGADVRVGPQALKRIRGQNDGGLIGGVVVEGVAPFRPVDALGRGEGLVKSEAPHMLNGRVREGNEVLVGVLAADAGTVVVGIGDVTNKRGGDGADTAGANDVLDAIAHKLLAGSRVDDGKNDLRLAVSSKSQVVREIAGLFGLGGHGALVGVFGVLLVPFLAIVTEGLVAAIIEVGDADGAVDAEAVVVLVIRRRLVLDVGRVPCRAVEEADGIKQAVTVDFKGVAVVAVAARLHLIGKCALAEAELRGEGGALNLVLFDQVEGRVVVGGVAFGLGLGNRNAVVHDFLFEIDAAGIAVREGVAGGSRSEELQLIDLAAAAGNFFGQRRNHFRLQRGAQFGLGGVEGDLISIDLNGLAGGAGVERKVDGRGGTDLDRDALLDSLLESGGVDRDRIVTGEEASDGVGARAAGGGAVGNRGVLIGDGYLGAGHNRSAGVGNSTRDAGAGLRECRPRRHGNQARESKSEYERDPWCRAGKPRQIALLQCGIWSHWFSFNAFQFWCKRCFHHEQWRGKPPGHSPRTWNRYHLAVVTLPQPRTVLARIPRCQVHS